MIKYKRGVKSYLRDIGLKGATWRAMDEIDEQYPDIAHRYFDFNGRDNKNGLLPDS